MENYRPVYLLVADDTPEFQIALRYTAAIAKRNNARVVLLHVMERETFQHWGTIEQKIHEESLREAHNLLFAAADTIKEMSGNIPIFYLEESGNIDVMASIIDQDKSITKFILGASTKSSNPGPLVSYFSGKGLPGLRVPVTIVPDSVDLSWVDSSQ